MNYLVFISSCTYLVLLLVLACLSVHLTCKLFSNFDKKNINFNSDLKKGNAAVGLCFASYILSMTIMMKNSISSGMSNLQSIINSEEIDIEFIFEGLGYIVIQFIMCFLLTLLVILIASRLYRFMTADIDEMLEISNGNVTVALVFSAVLISISTISSAGIDMLVGSLIPFKFH